MVDLSGRCAKGYCADQPACPRGRCRVAEREHERQQSAERTKRVARALYDEGIMAMDGRPATWERHRDGFMAMAERVLAAADRGQYDV